MHQLMSQKNIESRIFTIRKNQVMVDRDLADLYGVDTKALNQAVKRNLERFPAEFRFALTEHEKNELVTNCDRLENLKHSSAKPYVFTEQGVAMLSAILRSETAIKMSIQIINAFAKMRQFLMHNANLFHRLDHVEKRQLSHELKTDKQFEKIFNALEDKTLKPKQGIFFDGQIFDAYVFVSRLIKKATKSIILIDNYCDETTLDLLAKANPRIRVTILTKSINHSLARDLQKLNAQYPHITAKEFSSSHDRFLILDEKEIYHIGASLKDLGKKWFAFSQLEIESFGLMDKIKNLITAS